MQRIYLFYSTMRVVFLFFITLLSLSSYCQQPAPTQQQINEMLPNGIDPTQMTKSGFDSYFKDNNQKKTTGNDKNKENPEIARRLQNKSIDKDSTQGDNIKKSAFSPDQTYGANIFQNVAMNDVSELSTPPLDYPIGVGDHIVVSLWGGGEYQEDYIVARDGAIFPAGLGKITVQGLSFEVARSLIYSRFRSRVPEGTNIQVTLGQPRTININAGGEVISPGPITVSAFSNAFNVIGLAGGITEYGNLRAIQVKRGGNLIEVLDVYKYLTSGDLGKKIYLQNNDFVLVTFVEKKVLATGQFKRPMYYQLKKEEGVKALIGYSGGFTADAFTSGIKVIRTENETQKIRDVNATVILKLAGQDFLLNDGDIIKAEAIRPGIINKLELKGAVAYPGIYELRKNDRLFDVINRAGGVTKNTYLPRAYIFRGAGDSTNIKSDKLEVSLDDLDKDNSGSINNVALQANDIIQLFSNSEFGEQQTVSVYGEVRKEGELKKYGGMTLQDLIYLSGGLKPSAEYGRLEISSIVDIDSALQGLKPTRTIVKSYAIQNNLELDTASAKILLKPYDQVFVRKNPNFQLQQNVQILGLVKYGGLYPRLSKYERLSSYIERAGGIMENANLGGAILYRNTTELTREKIFNKPGNNPPDKSIADSALLRLDQPVSIDLFRAMKYKDSKHDIILQDNDLIYIPEINPFVSVQGRVQSPIKITFDKDHTNLSYYIDKAGGFGIRPWRKRVFVTYANGRSKRTKNLFFAHFYPKIEEGSTITIPERPEGKEITNALTQGLTTAIPLLLAYLILKL
ncbi:MAG: SLBB domain-containing protein [Ferruginibacter sp.]|nr:SLBB domain-containing protein [Ferruginibacter sp.]